MAKTSETLAELRAAISRIEAGQGSGFGEKGESSEKPSRQLKASTALIDEDDGAPCQSDNLEETLVTHNPSTKDNSKASAEETFARIVELVSHAPRATGDLRKRLKSERYPSDSINAAIDRACACLLLNDESFAENYARTRFGRGYGLDRIKRELHQKGIEPSLYPFWAEFLEQYDSDTETERALAYARSHMPASKHPGKSLYGSLVRRGFSSRIASETVRDVGLNLYD